MPIVQELRQRIRNVCVVGGGSEQALLHFPRKIRPKFKRRMAEERSKLVMVHFASPLLVGDVRHLGAAAPVVLDAPKPFCSWDTAKSCASLALATTASIPKNSWVTPP
jgi:hypothetical protein